MPNIHHQGSVCQICRKPSDIDPSGKNPDPIVKETGPTTTTETWPTVENRPTGSQSATDNVEAGNEPPTGNQSAEAEAGANQEPPTGNQSAEAEASANQDPLTDEQSGTEQNKDIPETEAQANSPPPKDTNTDLKSNSSDKVHGPARPQPKIITGNQLSEFILT